MQLLFVKLPTFYSNCRYLLYRYWKRVQRRPQVSIRTCFEFKARYLPLIKVFRRYECKESQRLLSSACVTICFEDASIFPFICFQTWVVFFLFRRGPAANRSNLENAKNVNETRPATSTHAKILHLMTLSSIFRGYCETFS